MKTNKQTRPLLILFLILIATGLQAQIYTPIASWYEWDRGRFKTQFRIPKDTLATADSNCIAAKAGILYLKAGNWQEVGKVDTNLLATQYYVNAALDGFGTPALSVNIIATTGSDYTATEPGYYELPNLTPEGNSRAFTLPTPANHAGKVLYVRNTSDSWEHVWLLTEPIYGPDNFPRFQFDAMTVYMLFSNGTAWVILSTI